MTPAYVGYSAYDMVHVIAEAIERAGGSTDLVTALEATDHVGTMGRIQFYGRDHKFTHAMKYGPGLSSTMRIFSSAAWCFQVARRTLRTSVSDDAGAELDFCLIFAP